MNLGEKIRAIRNALGLTFKDFAEPAGINRMTVYYIESGRRKPRQSTVRKIASAYKIDGAELARYSGYARGSRERVKIDRDWLIEQYVAGNLSALKIAESIECSKATVLNRLHQAGIEVRPRSGLRGPSCSKTFDKYPELTSSLSSEEGLELLLDAVDAGIISSVECYVLENRVGSNILALEAIADGLSERGGRLLTRERIRQIQNSSLAKMDLYLQNNHRYRNSYGQR